MRRAGFVLELTGACVSFLLAVATLIWHDWIELLTGIDPDGGNGAVELAVVVVLAGISIALGLAARAQWRRDRVASQRG